MPRANSKKVKVVESSSKTEEEEKEEEKKEEPKTTKKRGRTTATATVTTTTTTIEADAEPPVAAKRAKTAAAKAETTKVETAKVVVVEKKKGATKANKASTQKKDKEEEEDEDGGEDGAGEKGGKSASGTFPDNMTMPASYHFARVASGHLRIVSWNVNSLTAARKKGFHEYVNAESPDILCLQETKLQSGNKPMKLLPDYPHEFYAFSEEKKGYSGTAVFSKTAPLKRVPAEFDQEGRIITLEYEKFFLICCYVPNSGEKLVRLGYRQEWDKKMNQYLQTLDKTKPIVYCGDLNVAHHPIDLARPATNTKTAGFTKEEREDFTELLTTRNFVDSFRHLHPDMPGQYTYWGMRFRTNRQTNTGWRLDYFVLSQRLMPHVAASVIRAEAYGASDHVPIVLDLTTAKL